MLIALLKWLGFDPGPRPLTAQEDRTGSYNFGIPTADDRKALDDLVNARRKPQPAEELEAQPTGEPLSFEQFRSILDEIAQNHGFYVHKPGSKMIKYVRPNFDMRDGKCFAIRFASFGEETIFRWIDSAEPMYDRIMAWLAAPEK